MVTAAFVLLVSTIGRPDDWVSHETHSSHRIYFTGGSIAGCIAQHYFYSG
jgi:hypothetical protein